MDKIAVVFPGQASQYVGMGKDLYNADRDVRNLYDIASDEIGESIAEISFAGPADRLKETRFTQPAILLHSLAILTIMKDAFPRADIAAGHSLGEYGALALAGVLSFEEAVKAVVRRANLMEEACRRTPGTMAAVIGLDEEKIAEICQIASAIGLVVPANFNSANQLVISGSREGVAEACRLCKEMGAKRAMELQVGGAFHSPLMATAQKGMEEYLGAVDFSEPDVDIIPNVTAQPERNSSRLKELLVAQLTSPVKWYQTMMTIAGQEVDALIEVGPGKVLTGLARREVKEARIINIDTLQDIEEFSAVGVE
ncbi:MAG: ACP S-malonyltransferase [Candidatus Zixiibacteriota bacterium]|nr:MAG: ACP S-malonyltransferase [candidate division Zixibacteria bacterium]